MRFAGSEAPKLHELPGAKNGPLPDEDALPLHAKPVTGTIDYDALRNLPAANEAVKNHARSALQWTSDPSRYTALLMHGRCHNNRKGQCRLPDPDLEIMMALRKYEAAESIWAVGRAFTVPEWAKRRRRPVYEPYVNDFFSQVPTVAFRSREKRLSLVRRFVGGWAATIDFAAYYDQFSLAPAVRPFFGLRTRKGLLQATTLPMGFRASCAVAQWATWLITDLPARDDVEIMTYIDNVMVVAKTQTAVKQTMDLITERCKRVGVIINDAEKPCRPSQYVEFLGEQLDLRKGTVSLAPKTTEKIRVVREWAESFTPSGDWMSLPASNRQVTAVISLLLFASYVLGISTVPYYEAMIAYRRACHAGSLGKWETKHEAIRSSTWANILRWIHRAAANTPRQLPTGEERPIDHLIFVDASALGWGAVIVTNGQTSVISERWPAHLLPFMTSSVSAEPEALVRAVLATCTAQTKRVLVVSDHQPLVFAAARPHRAAIAWAYNHALLRLEKNLPDVQVSLEFVPGWLNIADKPSRGFKPSERDIQIAKEKEKQIREKAENGKTGKSPEGVKNSPEWAQTALNPTRARRDIGIGFCTG